MYSTLLSLAGQPLDRQSRSQYQCHGCETTLRYACLTPCVLPKSKDRSQDAVLTKPSGGYPKIVSQGINNSYLPIWLQSAGYATYYTGKLWNTHNIFNYNITPVNGFTGSDFLLDPYTYDYWHAQMTRNGNPPVDYTGRYSPDVVTEKAIGFLEEALEGGKPWMLTVAPIAPHSTIRAAGTFEAAEEAAVTDAQDSYEVATRAGGAGFAIPEYAPRHAHLFADYKIPRGENFNPEKVCKQRRDHWPCQ